MAIYLKYNYNNHVKLPIIIYYKNYETLIYRYLYTILHNIFLDIFNPQIKKFRILNKNK